MAAIIVCDNCGRNVSAPNVPNMKVQFVSPDTHQMGFHDLCSDCIDGFKVTVGKMPFGNKKTEPETAGEFDSLSSTDVALRDERFAGKAAAVDYIKAHPDCSEADAQAAYSAAALAVRPSDRQWLLHHPDALRQEYVANLVTAKLIPDTTWESWRAWIVATDRAVILGMN